MNSSSRVGAFFDLDGTLLPEPSLEWRFIAYLLERDEITTANVLRWLGRCAATLARGLRAAFEANKLYLAGIRESLAEDWQRSGAMDSIPLFLGGLGRIAWHASRGDRIFFVSGTLAPLARGIASALNSNIEAVATELDTSGGCWTGALADEHVSGKVKARAVRQLAVRHNLRLDQSYAYGNRVSDLAMLECVAHPAAVNPSARLSRIARLRGWPIWEWKALRPAPRQTCGQSAPWFAPKVAR